MLESLAQERQGQFVLARINTDECPGLAASFQIQAIPAVKGIRNGELVLEFEGVLPESDLRQFLDRIGPSEAENLAQQARARETTHPEEAEALYRRVLESDRTSSFALLGLARLLLAHRQDEEVEELLRRVGPGGDEASEVDRLNAILFLRRQAKEFGPEASLRPRQEADPENAELRYELGCVLAAAGRYPEALALLLSAAERDRNLAADRVRETMVKVFQAIGVRSELADTYRDKLRSLLY